VKSQLTMPEVSAPRVCSVIDCRKDFAFCIGGNDLCFDHGTGVLNDRLRSILAPTVALGKQFNLFEKDK